MIDNSILKRLAIQCGAEYHHSLTDNAPIIFDSVEELQAFAQAVIEDYKAGLVPAAYRYERKVWSAETTAYDYHTGSPEYYPELSRMCVSIEPLYALGETK